MISADVVVVGGGPAGLSAAIAAAEAGAHVVLIDENAKLGGKLLGQLHQENNAKWWIGASVSKDLADRAKATNVQVLTGREVWGIYPGWTIALDGGESVKAQFVVLATGAAERGLPIPGWTLPGVMAIGAAQTLTNYYRVRPGERIAVVGVDPLSLTVAHELKMAGAEVVGIYLPPADQFSGPRALPEANLKYLAGMADLAPNAFLKAGGKLASFAIFRKLAVALFPSWGIPVLGVPLKLRQSVVSVSGQDQVQGIETVNVDSRGNPSGPTKFIPVDCVCLSGGLYPLQELTAGCVTRRVEQLGGVVPLYSPELETTNKNVFVAGNVTGIEGAKIAMAQGTLAGTVIASRLGLGPGGAEIQRATEAVVKARENSAITFQPEIQEGRRIAAQMWFEHAAPIGTSRSQEINA